ncbi:LACCASE [Salix purpurea]|uniref:LACCASE n=1 Tax=Salix purpurea TaxID=77065 RepID=A0A9Q0UB84_SALPP|nr:LACCASE [Salix purpurea]
MAARAYQSAQNAPFDNTTTTAILEYKSVVCPAKCTKKPLMPPLPFYNDTATVTAFSRSFRSPRKVEVPADIDENLFFTIGLGLNNCVWLMHCHLDVHIAWGLAMAFLVEDGVGKLQSVEPPPADLPIC